MYNRYLQNSCPSEPQEPHPHHSKTEPCHDNRDRDKDFKDRDRDRDRDKDFNGGLLSSLSGLLGGREGGLSKLFDDNTLLILIILFFLLKDDEDGIDHDLLILAGVFLLLGL